MTWSYLGAAQSPKDAVRFAIGDTTEKMQAMTDEDILYLLDQHENDPLAASVAALRSLVAKYSMLCDQTVGSVSISYSQIRANFKETLGMLLANRTSVRGLPIAGGLSHAGSRRTYGNPDFKRPRFTRDSFGGNGFGQQSASGIGADCRDDMQIFGRKG